MSDKVVLVFDETGRAVEVYRAHADDVDYHFRVHKQGCTYRDVTRLPSAWLALEVQPSLTETDLALAALGIQP
jgi:hypothetical protein